MSYMEDKIMKLKNKDHLDQEILLKKSFNSSTTEEKDFIFIKSEIEKIINKEIKGINKIFNNFLIINELINIHQFLLFFLTIW